MLNNLLNNFKYQEMQDPIVGPVSYTYGGDWMGGYNTFQTKLNTSGFDISAPTTSATLSSNPMFVNQNRLQLSGPNTDAVSKLQGTNTTIKPITTPGKKPNIFQKAGAFMSQNAGMIGGGADTLNAASDAIFGQKKGLDGPKAELTTGIDSATGAVSDMLMKNPSTAVFGAGLKAANFLGNTINKLGGGTDGFTGIDAALNSGIGSFLTLGLNGFTGKNADTITKNDEAFAQVGSANGGALAAVDEMLKYSGAKFGGASSGARKDANFGIAQARMWQQGVERQADEATTRKDLTASMSGISSNRRAFDMNGGWDYGAVHRGKHGLKLEGLEEAKKKVGKYKKGKQFDPFQAYLFTLPKAQKDSANFRVRDYWEFNGKPKDFDEAVSKGMFTLEPDGWHANSVAENPLTGEIEFMKSSSHPNHHMEVDWYNSDDAAEFRSQYELQKTEPYWKYVKREEPQKFKEGGSINTTTEIFLVEETPEFKDGGTIESPITYIELVSEIEEFKEGGSINVIPDGSLHAHKHHMDIEGITPKGIPVVSEKEGGEIEQQAEIEKEEIIFRLEVTKKLEELAKDGSDEAAIEAGKLLVDEILYNTIDKTNNLL